MEPRRGRPPSAAKPGLFSSGGQTLTKQQKRSSSRSSILRKLNLSSSASLVNSNGVPDESQLPTAAAGMGNAGTANSQQATEQSGKHSFQKHLQKRGTQFLKRIGISNAPMLSGSNTTEDGDKGARGDDDHNGSDDDGDDDDEESPEMTPATATSPTMTAETNSRTNSIPKANGAPASHADAAMGGGQISHSRAEATILAESQPSSPENIAMFTVPPPPPPVLQNDIEGGITAVPPALPPKVPGVTAGPMASQPQTASALPTAAATRGTPSTKNTGEPKAKSGIIEGFRKLRRTDSNRTNTRPGSLNSNTAAPTTATTAATAAGVVSAPAVFTPPQPAQTVPGSPSKPPSSPLPAPTTSRGVDISGVPDSLRPGSGVQRPVAASISASVPDHGGHPPIYGHTVAPQAISMQQQQQQTGAVPCESCKAYYEAAWAQTQAHLYQVSAQLAQAHQQTADYINILHERDAQIAEQAALVERLRARIREQVQQLEQTPAGQKSLSGHQLSGISFGAGAGSVGQLPDGEVRTRWKGLRWQIRQCVEARIAALSSSSAAAALTVTPERAPFLRQLTPDYDKFLRSRAGSVHLVEAAIWALLADQVFAGARRSSRMCWAAHWSLSLVKINDNMMQSRGQDAAFHQWRAQTAAFVYSLSSAEELQAIAAPYAEAVVRQIEAEVGFLLALGTGSGSKGGSEEGGGGGSSNSSHGSASATNSSREGQGDSGSGGAPPPDNNNPSNPAAGFRQQLCRVVAEAIALDADLCQQRAWFYVHYPTAAGGQRHGMAFDAREMEVVAAASRDGGSGGKAPPEPSDGGSGAGAAAGGDGGGGSASLSVGNHHHHHSGTGGGDDVITLVIRPALFKAGNSRGEAYDEAEPLEPSIVCRAPSRGFIRRAGGRRDRSR